MVTVFTMPDTLQVGPVDVSVLVQRRDTGEVMLNADVNLFFTAPAGVVVPGIDPFCGPDDIPLRFVSTGASTESGVIPATRARATNKLLYAAPVRLPAAGHWQLRVMIQEGDAVVNVHVPLPVLARRTQNGNVWFGLALPPVGLALFALHQHLRRRLGKSVA